MGGGMVFLLIKGLNPHSRSARILVVDDEPLIHDLIEVTFQRESAELAKQLITESCEK